MNTEIAEREPETKALFVQSENLDQLLANADAETERMLKPVAVAIHGIIQGGGEDPHAIIRSERTLQIAADALAITRRVRKELKSFWKDAPLRPIDQRRPGEGWLYLVNKVRERLTTTFNKRDQYLERIDSALDEAIQAFRAEAARKALEEAEAKAAAERQRLEEQARKERLAAEEERTRLERIAQEERRRAEEEAERRRQAEVAAAQSAREKEQAERRAQEAKEEARQQEEQRRLDAEQEAARMRREAEELEHEAEDVVVDAVEPPRPVGYSARKVWRAECVDFEKLVKAVAEGKAPLTCVVVNESALNKLADAWGGQNPPPGVRFVPREISATRMRK